ncbi:hypothetical protein MuYL_1926 [Mucilaginibacter xinganensis]|uniref:Uncharacterized protein n=1 Tax=Mucilaginibacter xinganensis TaxID=1234841 RepID=A0A223NVC2_9SPHI|nr:hypothetical protein MuYL_1926 [Mucilaginibacter xinganensis]
MSHFFWDMGRYYYEGIIDYVEVSQAKSPLGLTIRAFINQINFLYCFTKV